ncbi:MAG: trypsin-like peptidase domain-containing protein [Planctomycetota bacterium]|jgi:hypothetical protein
MSSPLVQVGWLKSTVPIQNASGGTGTGFLLFRSTGKEEGQVFLVTNKHVVFPRSAGGQAPPRIHCHFNTLEADGVAGTAMMELSLVRSDGRPRAHEHPDPDTDVMAIDVTDVIVLNPRIDKKWVKYDHCAGQAMREELDITVGEEVVTIGYPLGLRQGETNLPLVRQGILSTHIGYRIRDAVRKTGGGSRERSLRAFLIDGATVPGSSGSPVILKPVIGRQVGKELKMGTAPPVLLGIVAETKYAPLESEIGSIPSFAGLGLAFEVETILETVERFFS